MPNNEKPQAAIEVLATAPLQAEASAPLAVPSLASQDEGSRILAVIQHSLDRGLSVEAMTGMFDLYERVQERTARAVFAAEFAAFQQECPAAPKSTHTKFVTKDGRAVEYDYADLEQLMETARPFLLARGFSISFSSEMQGQFLVRTCTIRHRLGHSVSASAPVTTASSNPGMSEQQKFAGAETSASRRALVAVLGLPLTDREGEDVAKEAESPPITREQSASLAALMAEVKVPAAKFCERFKLANVDDLRQCDYPRAVAALEERRKAVAK